ncbi:MAG TPA: hypothetical protein VHP14_14035 [Anaerolineales bacterium]|nr:hypothetical protein [Anaerolineales bacterium]
MTILYYLASFASLVCGIAVLIPLFQKEGVLKGILGIICMLYTYIWGWMHVKDESLKLKNWMYGWTVAIILTMILGFFVQQQMLQSY